MSFAVRAWYEKKVISRPLLSLLLFYKASISFSDNEDADQPRHFDAVRAEIELIKQRHSNAIFDNHGFSLKLSTINIDAGSIDISNDPTFTSSLRILADARGSYAHTFADLGHFTDRNSAKQPMTPEKSRDVVDDCLKLCKKISEDARKYTSV